jgi:hypothetical protein
MGIERKKEDFRDREFWIRELEKRQSHTHDTYKDEEADISCNNSQDGQMGLGHIP